MQLTTANRSARDHCEGFVLASNVVDTSTRELLVSNLFPLGFRCRLRLTMACV